MICVLANSVLNAPAPSTHKHILKAVANVDDDYQANEGMFGLQKEKVHLFQQELEANGKLPYNQANAPKRPGKGRPLPDPKDFRSTEEPAAEESAAVEPAAEKEEDLAITAPNEKTLIEFKSAIGKAIDFPSYGTWSVALKELASPEKKKERQEVEDAQGMGLLMQEVGGCRNNKVTCTYKEVKVDEQKLWDLVNSWEKAKGFDMGSQCQADLEGKTGLDMYKRLGAVFVSEKGEKDENPCKDNVKAAAPDGIGQCYILTGGKDEDRAKHMSEIADALASDTEGSDRAKGEVPYALSQHSNMVMLQSRRYDTGVGAYNTVEIADPLTYTDGPTYIPAYAADPKLLYIPQQMEGYLTFKAIQPAANAMLNMMDAKIQTIIFVVIGGIDYHLAYMQRAGEATEESTIKHILSKNHKMKSTDTPENVATYIFEALTTVDDNNVSPLGKARENEYVVWFAGKAGFAFVDTRVPKGDPYAHAASVKLLQMNVDDDSSADPKADPPPNADETPGDEVPFPIKWSSGDRVKKEVSAVQLLIKKLQGKLTTCKGDDDKERQATKELPCEETTCEGDNCAPKELAMGSRA